MTVCGPCLDGRAAECHTAGCDFWNTDAPTGGVATTLFTHAAKPSSVRHHVEATYFHDHDRPTCPTCSIGPVAEMLDFADALRRPDEPAQ